jgi:uroporphyrin-III C-methyltransferase
MNPIKQTATVTLVGAGPGDPELLTFKAAKAISLASVILVDDLVHPGTLKHARPDARIVHVGKRGGCQSTPQNFIEKLMVQEALAGENVVRLKGGDPLLFGRAGEEMTYLQSQGVQVKVVNGVTAGLAAANSMGLSLTHRHFAHGVVMVTGHSPFAQSPSPAVDWVLLGQTAHACRLTLVIYMGVNTVQDIQLALLKSMPTDTPVAAVQNASLATQLCVSGQLDALHSLLSSGGIKSPAIIVVGDVLRAISTLEEENIIEQSIYAAALPSS